MNFQGDKCMLKYKIAEVVFGVNPKYAYTPRICKDYLYEGDAPVAFIAEIPEQTIEKVKSEVEGCSAGYAESLEVFRCLCDYILNKGDGIIFHCSAVAVDGNAYLFAAPSGTGKSTHTRFWREYLGEKAVMINDDKPIIKYVDGEFYVYGTPWMGKHFLGSNTRAKIKAVCKLERGEKNEIEKASVPEMLLTVFNQTLRPSDEVSVNNLLSLTDKLLTAVALYKLKCTPDIEAAKLSYETMSKGE